MNYKHYISAVIIAFGLLPGCERDNGLVNIDRIPKSKVVDYDDEIKPVVNVSYEELNALYQLPKSSVTISEKIVLPKFEGDRSLQIFASNLVVDYFEMLLLSEKSNVNIYAKERMQKALHKHMDNMKEDYSGGLTLKQHKWFGNYNSNVNINNDRYLGITLTYSNYYGGAHGMHGTKYILIERKTLKPVEINKVVKDRAKAKDVIEKYFNSYLKNNEIKRSDLFLENGEYYLTNNFTVRNDSMVFNHHVYEIAPYYLGEIEFSVPLSELKPYLKQDLGL